MDEETRLRNAVRWRRRKAYDATRLDQAVQELVQEHVLPRQARFSRVMEVWERLLPESLAAHCEIVDITAGQLDVQVDSPSYLYELQLCSSELLDELQQQCPRVRLTKIRFIMA